MKTVTTSVGFQDPLGNLVLSGNLVLTLSQAAEVTSGGGLIAPKVVVLALSATTAKIASTQIYFSDELTPTGTTYHAELLDSGGNIIADFGQWSITGASADLSTMVPVSTFTTSLPGVVLLTPAANQHITTNNNLTTPVLNNVRVVDGTKFTTVSAALADLPASGGTVFIPAGTYLDNITVTISNVRLIGAGRGVTIITPSNVANPVLAIDATSVTSIDGFEAEDFSIIPVAATSCDAGIQIKGKTASNQPNDHLHFRRIQVGNNTQNTTGTNNFRHNLEIIGRTIWSHFDQCAFYGSRGDGLHLSLTGGTVGPVNATYFTRCEFNNNYNYGINWNSAGAVSLSEACCFRDCNVEFNANNTALSPCAGAIFQGIDNMILENMAFEENGASNADANRAHVRLTGATIRNIDIYGANFTNDTGTSAKYGIFCDCTVACNGTWTGLDFVGTGYTRTVHVAITANGEMRSVPFIGSSFNMMAPDITVDANGNSRCMSLNPLAFPVWSVGTAQFPITANVLDPTNTSTAQPGNTYVLANGSTVSKISNPTTGQIVFLIAAGTATVNNAVGGAGQITLREGANRTLAAGDAILLYSQDGANWKEIPLGASLLGMSNTWTQAQLFNSFFTKYNGLSTVRFGVPAEYALVDLTAQSAAIGTTTLYTTVAGGQYRLMWNAKVTTAAGVSSTLGALTIVYTDPDSVVQTITAPATIPAGTIATTNAGNTTTTSLIGMPLNLNVKAGTNITYAMAYASNAANAMQYNLHITLELM